MQIGLIFLARIAIVGFIVWLAWRALQPRPAFLIRIRNSQARTAWGCVTDSFLAEVQSVAREHAVTHGDVRGVYRTTRISLLFSRSFPEGGRQQLRNWWATSGWTPPQPRSCSR